MKIGILNHSPYVLLTLVALAVSLQPAKADPLKIVCIGDSITQGRGDHSNSGEKWFTTDGWRYDFWKLTVDNNLPVQFVGTMNSGFESTPNYAEYKGQKFTNLHEARWGWTTEGVLNQLKKVHTQWKADVALIYLGTNREPPTDAEKTSDPDGVKRTVNAMTDLVTLLQQDNPKVTVLIRAMLGSDARSTGLNDGYRKIATDMSTPESKVAVVEPSPGWQWDPKQPNADTVDGCHPNKQGDTKLAADFWQTLQPLLPVGPPG